MSSLQRQDVARRSGGTYTVRTFEIVGRTWRLVREVPASARDVAQATLHGDVVDL